MIHVVFIMDLVSASGSRTIVIVLIVVPLIVLGLVLLMLYKKKGKEVTNSNILYSKK